MNRICLDDMYVFTKVAENKSITIASEKLGMSKQTVSRKVSKLEESLSVLLIARSTRSFELTAAGLEYYHYSASIFREVGKVNDIITEFQKSPSGTIKLGMPDFFPLCHFSTILTQYLELNPGVNIHISHHCKESDLISNSIDIAFRIGSLNDSSMIARKLGKIKFVHVASNEYLNKHGSPKNICDLKNHNIIEVENYLHQNYTYKQKVTSNNFYIAKDFVINGFGISIIPLYMVSKDVLQGKLVVLGDETFVIEKDINIVYLGARHLPRQVRELVEFLVGWSR